MIKDVLSATDDELRTMLLTVDGQGKANKRRALEELLARKAISTELGKEL